MLNWQSTALQKMTFHPLGGRRRKTFHTKRFIFSYSFMCLLSSQMHFQIRIGKGMERWSDFRILKTVRTGADGTAPTSFKRRPNLNYSNVISRELFSPLFYANIHHNFQEFFLRGGWNVLIDEAHASKTTIREILPGKRTMRESKWDPAALHRATMIIWVNGNAQRRASLPLRIFSNFFFSWANLSLSPASPSPVEKVIPKKFLIRND